MSLLECQIAFRAAIAADDDAAPSASPGMAIYRDGYRARLLAALEESFARTRRWVGEEAFAAAACHHILTHPPRGWTLDDYGANFPDTLAELFVHDGEVCELAWLEWHLQQAFAARDQAQLDVAALSVAGLGEADWGAMQFAMAAGFALRTVTFNCAALWEALADSAPPHLAAERQPDAALLVWRADLVPRYRIVQLDEMAAIRQISAGLTLGELAALVDSETLGTWLAQWLGDGLLAELEIRALPQANC